MFIYIYRLWVWREKILKSKLKNSIHNHDGVRLASAYQKMNIHIICNVYCVFSFSSLFSLLLLLIWVIYSLLFFVFIFIRLYQTNLCFEYRNLIEIFENFYNYYDQSYLLYKILWLRFNYINNIVLKNWISSFCFHFHNKLAKSEYENLQWH